MKTHYLENTLEVGIDEAGRGPMFGRVYVGAVIIPPDETFKQSFIKDSKKLSERKRLIAYDFIKEYAIDYTSFYYDEKEIDEKNIFKATYEAMHKAVDKLLVKPEHILVDGCYFPIYTIDNTIIPYTCVEGGDNKYLSIAAASIAQVHFAEIKDGEKIIPVAVKILRPNIIETIEDEMYRLDWLTNFLENFSEFQRLQLNSVIKKTREIIKFELDKISKAIVKSEFPASTAVDSPNLI